jgi:hypothetical protein
MWVRPPPALQNLGEVHSEVFVFRYDISPDMEARRLYPVTLLPGRYPWDIDSLREQVLGNALFSCLCPPCSLLMLANIIYYHVYRTREILSSWSWRSYFY